MNCYETLFVLKSTLTDEETQAQIEKIKDVLTKVNAELLATNLVGTRKLAYEVEKQKRGYYTVIYFNAEGEAINEIERNLRINEEIIKFLTIKYTNKKEIAYFEKTIAHINRIETPKEEVKEEVVTPETTPEVISTETKEETLKETSTETKEETLEVTSTETKEETPSETLKEESKD